MQQKEVCLAVCDKKVTIFCLWLWLTVPMLPPDVPQYTLSTISDQFPEKWVTLHNTRHHTKWCSDILNRPDFSLCVKRWTAGELSCRQSRSVITSHTLSTRTTKTKKVTGNSGADLDPTTTASNIRQAFWGWKSLTASAFAVLLKCHWICLFLGEA